MYYFQTWLNGREGLEALTLPDKIKLYYIKSYRRKGMYLFKSLPPQPVCSPILGRGVKFDEVRARLDTGESNMK